MLKLNVISMIDSLYPIEKLNATITSSKVALSLTILTFDYKVAFSFSIGVYFSSP
jgi:hypothetical protein